jgi:hypothetical protein
MNTKTLLLVLAILPTTLYGQSTGEPNVLSYYAVGNSLDGQPMVDMPNVLRFFPVFVLQQTIDTVRITAYYGGRIFSRFADPSRDRKYWESSLPQFRLGEAIQRLEVETTFRLPKRFGDRLRLIDSAVRDANDASDADLKERDADFSESKKMFGIRMQQNNDEFEKVGIVSAEANKLRLAYTEGREAFVQLRNSLLNLPHIPKLSDKDSARSYAVFELTKSRAQMLGEYSTRFEAFRSYSTALKKGLIQSTLALVVERDSIVNILAKELQVDLLDTSYTGPSVRRCDLIIDETFKFARILYRNYKGSLRHMAALDPAERMGIFRARYVPFPIVGTQSSPRMNLKKPMSTTSPTVFEIGLAFGDAIVPGDEFVVPEFSWRRLGVAFAITERLFSDSAEVIGLALTYDFNSYGSIGIGGNFARNEVHGYASLGINKKAFEAVIKGLAGLFK